MIIREYSENDTEEITLLMKHLCELKNQEFDEIRWRRSLENQMKQNSNSEVFVAIDDDAADLLLFFLVQAPDQDAVGQRLDVDLGFGFGHET